MIKKIICFVWGHRTTHRACTGETITRTNPLTQNEEIVPLTQLVRVPFCERCGKKFMQTEKHYRIQEINIKNKKYENGVPNERRSDKFFF